MTFPSTPMIGAATPATPSVVSSMAVAYPASRILASSAMNSSSHVMANGHVYERLRPQRLAGIVFRRIGQ